MYSSLQKFVKFTKYWLGAANGKGHGIHSPFVFQFVTDVLNDDRFFYTFENIEATVNADLNNKKFNRLLFKIINYYQPKSILLVDETLGITASYMALANTESTVTSYHSHASTIKPASETTTHLNIQNISFSSHENSLQHHQAWDLVFINPKNTTLLTEQLNKIIPQLHSQSILIVNNIHIYGELETIWYHLQTDTSVTLTIDLFQMGLVFFRPENKVAQHFTIRF